MILRRSVAEMGLLVLYWGFMLAAYIIAARNRHKAERLTFIQKAMMPLSLIHI